MSGAIIGLFLIFIITLFFAFGLFSLTLHLGRDTLFKSNDNVNWAVTFGITILIEMALILIPFIVGFAYVINYYVLSSNCCNSANVTADSFFWGVIYFIFSFIILWVSLSLILQSFGADSVYYPDGSLNLWVAIAIFLIYVIILWILSEIGSYISGNGVGFWYFNHENSSNIVKSNKSRLVVTK